MRLAVSSSVRKLAPYDLPPPPDDEDRFSYDDITVVDHDNMGSDGKPVVPDDERVEVSEDGEQRISREYFYGMFAMAFDKIAEYTEEENIRISEEEEKPALRISNKLYDGIKNSSLLGGILNKKSLDKVDLWDTTVFCVTKATVIIFALKIKAKQEKQKTVKLMLKKSIKGWFASLNPLARS